MRKELKGYIKKRMDNPFGRVPNTLSNNPKISLKAKGLYAYMDGKPTDWEFSVRGLASQLKEGQDAIASSIRELEAYGYLSRKKYQDTAGFWRVEYSLYAEPNKENPCTGNPDKENPSAGKPPNITKKELTKKELTKKELTKNTLKDTKVSLAKANKSVVIKNVETSKKQPVKEIIDLHDYWQAQIGYPITSKQKLNRYACNNLLKKFGVVGVQQLIRAVQGAQEDKYAPAIADFIGLQSKLNDLLAWAKKKGRNGKIQQL